MNLFLFIFLLMILGIKCEEDCKSTSLKSTTQRLIDQLLCDYGRVTMDRSYSIDPLYPNKVMTFNVRLLPQYVEFEKRTDTLQFFTWLNISWFDTDLMWDPIRWDGIRWININSNYIETPELRFSYRGDESESSAQLSLKNCLLTYDGSIHCVTPTRYTCYCPTDYSEWPYDKHNCSLYIGAWKVQYGNMVVKFDDNAINMTAFRPNKRWHISFGVKNLMPDANMTHIFKRWLAVSVLLERRGSRLAIMYILPIVVFMTLTLIVLWLDSQSFERIVVASLNLLFHILGLCNLHKNFPEKGSLNTPQIILSYETSIGLAAYALIFTCLLRKLRSLKVSAPTWLVSATTLVINSPVTPYLGIATNRKRQTDVRHESENNGCPNNSTWQEFATILEWVSFILVIVTYAITLGIVLAPKEPRVISNSWEW